jgi:hypothetical protein
VRIVLGSFPSSLREEMSRRKEEEEKEEGRLRSRKGQTKILMNRKIER